MSKYMKIEDVIERLDYRIHLADTGFFSYEEMMKRLRADFADLPTIEISEGVICQGRGDMFNDCQAVASAGQEMYAKGYEDGRKSVEVSEDCISREYLKSLGYINKGDFNSVETIREWIDNAPSVVPKQVTGRAEGEWIEHKRAEAYDGLMKPNYECSQCHDWLRERSNYCPTCGAKMKG